MNDENWLERAYREGRLDKIVEGTNRDYDEGRALDTLEPSPARSGSQPVFRSLHRMGSRLKLGAQMWRGYYGATRHHAGHGAIFSAFNATRLWKRWLVEKSATD